MTRTLPALLLLLLSLPLLNACAEESSRSGPGADAFAPDAGADVGEGVPDISRPGPDVPPVPYGGWDPVAYAGTVWGHSYEGRAIVAERFGDEGPVVFLFFTIHGNEVTAEQLGQRVRTWLVAHPEYVDGVQIAYVTQANPDGYLAGTRHNTNFEFNAEGVDLNRNFPAANFNNTDKPQYGPFGGSESETQAIVAIVEDAAPSVIVSTHAPLEVVNYDGPAADYAEAAAAASGYPVDVDLGPYPGSFGSYAGVELQIPTITLELERALGSLAGHEPGIAVIETVLAMAPAREPLSADVADVITTARQGDPYEGWKLGDSAGQRPLLVERFGQGEPVMAVIAGLDGSQDAVLTAERLRALLLGLLPAPGVEPPAPIDTLEGTVYLLTVANPDGLAAGRDLNNAGLAPDACFPGPGWAPGSTSGEAPLEAPEAALLATWLESLDLAAALVVIEGGWAAGGDGEAGSLLRRLRNELNVDEDPALGGRPGSLAEWLGDRDVPTLTLAVSPTPAAHAVHRADSAAEALLLTLRAIR